MHLFSGIIQQMLLRHLKIYSHSIGGQIKLKIKLKKYTIPKVASLIGGEAESQEHGGQIG